MNQQHIRECLIEALQKTYDIFRIQSGHELSDKQKRFIKLATLKICGKEPPKEKVKTLFEKEIERPSFRKKYNEQKETLKPDKDDKPFYECPTCHKKCSSTSGLTLHQKLTHGAGV